MNRPLVVHDVSELEPLRQWRITPSTERFRIKLDIDAPPEKIRAWERVLTRSQSPCGCEKGAGGLLLGILACLLYLWFRPGGWGDPGSREWLACAAAVTVTTSAGKGIGVWLDRRLLRRTIEEIRLHPNRVAAPAAGGHLGESTFARTPARPRGCCG